MTVSLPDGDAGRTFVALWAFAIASHVGFFGAAVATDLVTVDADTLFASVALLGTLVGTTIAARSGDRW